MKAMLAARLQDTRIYQEAFQEGYREGYQIGKREAQEEIALRLLERRDSLEETAAIVDLPIEEIQQIAQQFSDSPQV
ncbi:hypothetical protein ACQ4M3_24525 [Leptolyngbya sp. AN03gr2]|uniref:hypothetical protein n=1 Tax=unclassified Leptolyngbya TaxID=2650499 RepID=UPI003D314E63